MNVYYHYTITSYSHTIKSYKKKPFQTLKRLFLFNNILNYNPVVTLAVPSAFNVITKPLPAAQKR